VLTILELRGIAVDARSARRIRSCKDPQQLEGWASRARQVGSVAELF
jgi:hypothetical protein